MGRAEANPGYAGGIAKRSRATQLAWALKGAPLRRKDLCLNAVAGIAEARKLRDRVTRLMLDAKANPEDTMVICIFAEPDLSAFASPVPFAELGVKNGPSDLALVSKFVDKLPIGFLVFVWDRQDPLQSIFGHARPLIVEDQRGIEFNQRALAAYERVIKKRLMRAGVIPDETN